MVIALRYQMEKHMCNKAFTLAESIIVLCLTSFLILLSTIQLPMHTSLDLELQQVKERYLQTQVASILKRERNEIQFTNDAFCTMEVCYPYAKGISSDTFSLKFYENGTINQAKTICFYRGNNQKCLYIQLGSGQLDIR